MLLSLAVLTCHVETASAFARSPAANTCVSQTVTSGPVTLTTTVDASELRVASPFHVTLTATTPSGVRVQFPDRSERLGNLLVTDVQDAFDVPDGEDRTWTRTLTLEALRSDIGELPTLTLAWQGPAGTGTITSSPLPLSIVSEVESEADLTLFRDLKGVAELPKPATSNSGLIAVVSVGGLLLGLATWWMFAGRQRLQSPAQWALSELDRLESDGLLECGEYDEFFCRVTGILRTYIERQMGIRAPRLTTREFLDLAETSGDISSDQRRRLQAFLKLADAIKFARFAVSKTDASSAVAHCRHFIQESHTSSRVSAPTSESEPTRGCVPSALSA